MEKKYRVTAKVGNNVDGTANCIKHHTSDLLEYVKFLDREHATWRWFNVYSKATGLQLGSFTKNRRPTSRFIQ